MSRTSTRIALLALLATVLATARPGTVPGDPRSACVDGTWRDLFASSSVVPETTPVGIAFDPARNELVAFRGEIASFRSLATPPSPGRDLRAPCRGAPAGYSVAFVSKHDEFVCLLLDSLLFKYGTF